MYAPNIAQQIRLDLLERSFQGGMPAAVDQNLDPRDSRLRAAVQARVRSGVMTPFIRPHVVE